MKKTQQHHHHPYVEGATSALLVTTSIPKVKLLTTRPNPNSVAAKMHTVQLRIGYQGVRKIPVADRLRVPQ